MIGYNKQILFADPVFNLSKRLLSYKNYFFEAMLLFNSFCLRE